MITITTEAQHRAYNWLLRAKLQTHKKYRVYLRSLARVSNFKQL